MNNIDTWTGGRQAKSLQVRRGLLDQCRAGLRLPPRQLGRLSTSSRSESPAAQVVGCHAGREEERQTDRTRPDQTRTEQTDRQKRIQRNIYIALYNQIPPYISIYTYRRDIT